MGKAKGSGRKETRCECGHLIAKIRGKNLEIKCKRCKRLVTIPYDSLKETECDVVFH